MQHSFGTLMVKNLDRVCEMVIWFVLILTFQVFQRIIM